MSSESPAMAALTERDAVSERRSGADRRRHSLNTISYCGLSGRGRRRTARRDGHNYYLDWYHPRLVLTGLTVLMLSCLDAMFTLTLLGRGAHEANYFMAVLLEIDHALFVAVKVAITGICVTFLLMHANFNILRITNCGAILRWLVPAYGVLIVYELILLSMLA